MQSPNAPSSAKVHRRTRSPSKKPVLGRRAGANGAAYLSERAWARCGRTTAKTATRGAFSPRHGPQQGDALERKTASAASAISPSAAVPVPGPLEWVRSNLEGAAFGLAGPRATMEKTSNRNLLLPRRYPPTFSYLRYLYKYPQRPSPYTELIEENRRRTPKDREYEIVDSSAFVDDRLLRRERWSTRKRAPPTVPRGDGDETEGPRRRGYHVLRKRVSANTLVLEPRRGPRQWPELRRSEPELAPSTW